MPRRLAPSRSAFSLVEALIAVAIMGMAGSAIMLGVTSSLHTTQASLEATIAMGVAEQRIDEVLGRRYAAPGVGPYQTVLVANSWELQGQGRERFDDTDDYNGFVASPIEGVWGEELGQGDDQGDLRHANFRLPAGYFNGWREEIEVYYVNETNHSIRLTGNNTSNYRAVEVRILRDNGDGTYGQLVNLRRVYAYVPSPQ